MMSCDVLDTAQKGKNGQIQAQNSRQLITGADEEESHLSIPLKAV